MSDELLPCPFCGGSAHLSGVYYECDNPHPQVKISCQQCWDVAMQCGSDYRAFQKDKVAGEKDLIARAIAAWNRRHAPAEVAAWQPIQTAPKDGTSIIACCIGFPGCGETAWDSAAGGFRDCVTKELVHVTHWQPLPPPPLAVTAETEPEAKTL